MHVVANRRRKEENVAQKRKKANDPKISKSFKAVNELFNTESEFQRQQREAEAQAKRAKELREQRQEIMRKGSGGAAR